MGESYYVLNETLDQNKREFIFDLTIGSKGLSLEVSSKNLKEGYSIVKSRALYKENDYYKLSKPTALLFLELITPLLCLTKYKKNRLLIKEFYQFFFTYFPDDEQQEKVTWILEKLRLDHEAFLPKKKKRSKN